MKDFDFDGQCAKFIQACKIVLPAIIYGSGPYISELQNKVDECVLVDRQ